MKDAIEQRVEQFVQEILGLVEQAEGERRAAALSVVTAMLAEGEQPPTARASSPRRPPTSPSSSRERAASRKGAQDCAGGAKAPANAAPTPAAAPATATTAPTIAETEAPLTKATAPSITATQATAPTITPTETPSITAIEIASPMPEREAAVLDALRALVRATASEIAQRTSQPNGSVVVTFRALAARGLVTRSTTARGVEYGLVSTGSVQPFKRVRRGEGAAGQAGEGIGSWAS